MNSKRKRSRPAAAESSNPGTIAPPEILDRAARIDEKIAEETGGADSAAATMSGSGVADSSAPAKTKRGRRSKAEIEAEAKAKQEKPPNPLAVALMARVTTGLVAFATHGAGWSIPTAAELVEKDGKTDLQFSHESWLREVNHCEVALYQKYCPNLVDEYAAEIGIAVLILPWAAENMWRAWRESVRERQRQTGGGRRTESVPKTQHAERTDNRDSGQHGNGQNHANEKTHAEWPPASDPSGHDELGSIPEMGGPHVVL